MRLNRTETVTVRLDPETKTRAAEAAQQSRRTLSSWIEYIVIGELEKEDKDGQRTSNL